MKLLLAAATDWRSLVWLGIGLVLAAVLSNPFPAMIGLGVYLWVIRRMVQSPDFQERAERVRLAAELVKLHRGIEEGLQEFERRSLKPSSWLKNVVSALTNPEREKERRVLLSRASSMTTCARSIYRDWLAHPQQQVVRAPLVEEALKLAYLYLRILRGYQTMYVDAKKTDLWEIRTRMGRNARRLEQTTDPQARRDLARSIELDQRVLDQMADGEARRERYQTRLAAIESTMEALRHRIFDSDLEIETEADVGRVHEMLQEAEAMDQALGEVRQRSRVR